MPIVDYAPEFPELRMKRSSNTVSGRHAVRAVSMVGGRKVVTVCVLGDDGVIDEDQLRRSIADRPRKRHCLECGEALTGRRARFCCPKHSKRYSTRQARLRGDAWTQKRYAPTLVPLTCTHCAKDYKAAKPKADDEHKRTYCSPDCLNEARSWQQRTVFSCKVPWRSCVECKEQYLGRGQRRLCPTCTDRETRCVWYAGYCPEDGQPFVTLQPAQRCCSPRCSSRRNRTTRRARKKQAYVEDVWRKKVYERDDWTCRICNEPVDRDAEVPEHLAPTLDHILPLALGGDHSYANIQTAHFICNCRKSHNVEGQLAFAA